MQTIKLDVSDLIKQSGEVAAIAGYELQYTIFATEIYNALLEDENEIEWVEFASQNAGKLDDVLIGRKNTILAYQVKNINSATFTYNTFVESRTESILKGMFSGWKQTKLKHPEKEIDVRFITTQAISSHDRIKSYLGKPNASFRDFLNQFWIPIKNRDFRIESLSTGWRIVFEELQKKINGSDEELISFIKSTSFHFDYSPQRILDSYVERQRRLDIEEISKKIFKTVAKNGNIRFSKKEFLEHFGLSNRYESYYTHSFFVDEQHYQPLGKTIEELNELIRKHSNGYLAVIGNAGSGKSTFLTKWIQQGKYKVLKYYAYVNTDMSYEDGFRGEAKAFLHDLLTQIRQSKFSSQERIPTDSLEDLQRHFNNELNRLSNSEEKVFIVVDGLDHIEREQEVSRSLISVLPLPQSIPDNVYFILGTRSFENLDKLHARVVDCIKEEKRAVRIQSLSMDQVHDLLTTYHINLSEELLQSLYVNTKGHPLFLRYTIEEIKGINQLDLEDLINKRIFSGDINQEYRVFWEKYKEQDDFIEILGILSRFRHSIFDITLLSLFTKISRSNQYQVNRLAENYFFRVGKSWQFFHNSFKEFLIQETAKDILTGAFDKGIDRSFHIKILEATENIETSYKWNNLYHLYQAERFHEITQRVTQEYFRMQWFEYRSYKLIKEDIQIAINAANKIKDPICLFRSFLSLFELKQRYHNFDPAQYFDTFYQIGRINLANSFIYDNVELLISQTKALDYCLTIYFHGYEELALDIFQRATPYYILNHSKIVSSRRLNRDTLREEDEIELVCTWACAASIFLPIDEICNKIKNISVENNQQEDEGRDLLYEAAIKMLEPCTKFNQSDKLKSLESYLLDVYKLEDLFYFYFEVFSKINEESDYYSYCLEILANWPASDNNPINRRLLKIQILQKQNFEKARQIFELLIPPAKIEIPDYSSNETGFANYVFDYSQFLYIITKDFSIPASTFLPSEKKHSKIAFYHAFAELGRSYAYIVLNNKDAGMGFNHNFQLLLNLFHCSHTDPNYEYSISQSKPLLINLVLEISSLLSLQIFQSNLQILSKEWNENSKFWRTSEKQEIVEWVIDSKYNKQWCEEQLRSLNDSITNIGYVEERIEKAVIQIRLWSKLQLIDECNQLLGYLMNVSLDVRGEKDNQLDHIVAWIKFSNSDELKEACFYLERLASLNKRVNSRSHTPAMELFKICLPHGNGSQIFKYLLFEGLITFNDSIEILLTHLISALPHLKTFTIKLFARIVLAYDDSNYCRTTFFDKLLSNFNLSKKEIETLLTEISINSVSELTGGYLAKIQEYAFDGSENFQLMELKTTKKEKSSSNKDELTMRDGIKLSLREVLEKTKSISDLQSLRNQSQYYDFHWHPVYCQVFKAIPDEEVIKFVKEEGIKSSELVKIAKGLIENNRIKAAKQILYYGISAAPAYGWVKYIDGGSKILPFQILQTIESKEVFQNAVFSDFCNSLSDLDIQSMESVLNELQDVWSYFTDDLDKNSLYHEIRNFGRELLKTHFPQPNLPEISGSQGNEELITEIVFFIATMPSDFNDALFRSIAEEVQITENLGKMLLDKLYNNRFFLKYLKLLAVMALKRKDIVRENLDRVVILINSDRYDIHQLAYNLIISINLSPEAYHKPTVKKLPLLYNMKLTYYPSIFNTQHLELEHIDKKGFLKETSDPLVLTRIYKREVEILAGEAEIELINIAHRIVALGTDNGFPDWCRNLSEEDIRNVYSNKFNLEIAYKRPRSQFALDGLMKVIKELLELDLIDKSTANSLLTEFDEHSLLNHVIPRPRFVKPILEISGSAPSARREWAEEITDNYLDETLQFQTSEGSIILAEFSVLEGMGWGMNEEVRQSLISTLPRLNFGSERTLIFNFTSRYRINEYLELANSGIILYNSFATVDKKRNYLAINPLLCKEMGLVFNASGNFRWDDSSGNKIIESIYWQIHSTDNSSRHHHSEAGYGWCVILYERGEGLFKTFFKDKKLYRHKKISRHIRFAQEKYQTKIEEDYHKFKSEKLG